MSRLRAIAKTLRHQRDPAALGQALVGVRQSWRLGVFVWEMLREEIGHPIEREADLRDCVKRQNVLALVVAPARQIVVGAPADLAIAAVVQVNGYQADLLHDRVFVALGGSVQVVQALRDREDLRRD